ncbi:sigma70-ECF, RNA polymerase sigma factor, sigma-70 family [Flavobacteriaceae bacterium]
MADKNNFSNLTDQELVIKIKGNSDYLGIVYKRCKSNCLGFMRKMTSGKISDYELEDVFQDANIILYEKIVRGDFVLTASFQTYLNSVCRFQLLNTLEKSKLTTDYQDNSNEDDDENPNGFHSSITDSLDAVDHSNEPQFLAIETALEKMKDAGGHCYELLTLFWYHKKSMNELTTEFGYNNSDTTKTQKARCQKRLEKIAYNELNQ